MLSACGQILDVHLRAQHIMHFYGVVQDHTSQELAQLQFTQIKNELVHIHFFDSLETGLQRLQVSNNVVQNKSVCLSVVECKCIHSSTVLKNKLKVLGNWAGTFKKIQVIG